MHEREGYGKQGSLGPEKVRGRWTVGNNIAAQEGGSAVNNMPLMASFCPGPILARSLSSGLKSRKQAGARPQLCHDYTNDSRGEALPQLSLLGLQTNCGLPSAAGPRCSCYKTTSAHRVGKNVSDANIKSVRMYQMQDRNSAYCGRES